MLAVWIAAYLMLGAFLAGLMLARTDAKVNPFLGMLILLFWPLFLAAAAGYGVGGGK